ncbi:hypothetical protein [Natrinema salinisoli]|uniref:hypothetical protein n=1 Tax=Natrinema salinisoli TaxID=2878535 RepID=UPI001CEFEF4F|nr:hypothetical protein [Natrinema salinisoli]
MNSSDRPTPTHNQIATELTAELSAILFVTLVLSAPIVLFAFDVGPIALLGAGLVIVLALWFTIRAVLAALDDLLEAKLEAIDWTEQSDSDRP